MSAIGCSIFASNTSISYHVANMKLLRLIFVSVNSRLRYYTASIEPCLDYLSMDRDVRRELPSQVAFLFQFQE